MKKILGILAFAFLLFPALALAQAKPGFYSGKLKCVSGDRKYSYSAKYEVSSSYDLSDVLYDEFWSLNTLALNSGNYSGLFDSDDYSGRQTCNLSTNGNFSQSYSGFYKDGSPLSGECAAKLMYTSKKDNISLWKSDIIYKTRCYNLKKATNFEYGFNDTGGYYARFKLVARPCGGSGGSKTIKDFKKYQETASFNGRFNLSKGKWKFSILSTDSWWIENMPGLK